MDDEHKRKIFCIGGASIDRHFHAKQAIQPHSSNPVTSGTFFGGCARNVAANLAQLRQHIYLQSVVGDDAFGRAILADARQLQIDVTDVFALPGCETAHYYSILASDGELHLALADMPIYQKITWQTFAKITTKWDQDSFIFLDTNLDQSIIDNVVLHCEKRKLKLFVDPISYAKSAKIRHLLSGLYLLKANKMEASALLDCTIKSTADALCGAQRLVQLGVQQVVISLGGEGYIIANEHQQTHFPVEKIHDIKNVVGCGDAMMAGILYGLSVGASIENACAMGANLASMTVQAPSSVLERT